MAELQATLGLYLHLARACEVRRRPLVRDKFLILAGVLATEMNLPTLAHFCRRQILTNNPGHLLRQFPSFRHATEDERFGHYLVSLQRTYPLEKAESMLESLGIDRARERATYESDLEYAAALLGTTPQELERWSDEPTEAEIDAPGLIGPPEPPSPPPAQGYDFMSADPLPDDNLLSSMLLGDEPPAIDPPGQESPSLHPDTFAPPPRNTEIMALGEDSSQEVPIDGPGAIGPFKPPLGRGNVPPAWDKSPASGRPLVPDPDDSMFAENLTKHGLSRCPDFGMRGDRPAGRQPPAQPGNAGGNAGNHGKGKNGHAAQSDRPAWWGQEPAEAGPASSLSLNRLLPTGPGGFHPSGAPPENEPPLGPTPSHPTPAPAPRPAADATPPGWEPTPAAPPVPVRSGADHGATPSTSGSWSLPNPEAARPGEGVWLERFTLGLAVVGLVCFLAALAHYWSTRSG